MGNITAIISFTPKHRKFLQGAISSASSDVPVSVVPDDPRKGKWKRLNDLIKEINTEWVAMLDADDVCIFNRFLSVSSLLGTSDLIYTDYVSENKNGEYRLVDSRKFDYEVFKNKNFIPFSTVLVRTEICRQIPFIDSMGPGARALDWVWMAKVYKDYPRFTYVPVPTVIRRDYTSSFQSKIPVWRKLHRLYCNRRARRMICAMD